MKIEVERKFLLAAAPDLGVEPFRSARLLDLEQGFLLSGQRLRRSVDVASGMVVCSLTSKRFLSPGVSEEDEVFVSEESYSGMRSRLDPTRPSVRKFRRVFSHAGRVFELDEVLSPSRVWVLEVELASPSELGVELSLPPGLSVAQELTFRARPRRSVLVPTPRGVREAMSRIAALPR